MLHYNQNALLPIMDDVTRNVYARVENIEISVGIFAI